MIFPLIPCILLILNLVPGFAIHAVKPDPTNEAAIAWNRTAYTIAHQHDQFNSFIGVRALAMSSLAMHDALNGIDRRFEPYATRTDAPDADPIAAISQAAYDVLAAAYPARKDTLRGELERWLGTVDDAGARARGVALGHETAAALIRLRDGDGHEKNGDYTPMTKPGDYQYTPGFDYVWKPDFSYARPFTLDSLTQFHAPPPPPLTSEAYARSLNEVKAYGKAGSTVRSADQTHIAHWWAEFGEHGWNRIGRITAQERNLPLWETVRMFALINVNLYDLYLVSFESKYAYDTWRPYTAIRQADEDGNPATEKDPDWQPEMVTPPWPEYPSAHAAVGAGGAEIVAAVYGTPMVGFTMASVTAPEGQPNRTYASLDAAADDCADSRIYNGFHFRFATEAGKRQGRALARHVVQRILRPVNR
ncbi:MAG: vanadium-dependent haloperoxidase [Rhodothermales bacterium]